MNLTKSGGFEVMSFFSLWHINTRVFMKRRNFKLMSSEMTVGVMMARNERAAVQIQSTNG